ncbi:prolyl 4-hydroxylase subunit alpha-3 [Drosophila innubila]|uniref:prolyl 4-hydroxylase subunit alpha-3 n=1 Tax=Drosophila innubila TaxID=198719 RepID=UPI00148BB6F6|nr:prolyl 4-hydroxylase subunit alpha-3 [Drosophila innubila]
MFFFAENFPGIWTTFNQVFKYSEKEEQKQEAETYMNLAQQHLSHLSNCRGLGEESVSSSLKCSYNTISSPFLRLAPLKLEQLSLDPQIVLYHDVIYKQEIADILRLTKPYFRRALVGSDVARSDVRRGSMRVGLAQNASLSIERLNRRLKDMSGFELSFNKELEVINYGIGGQYYMHYKCRFELNKQAYLENNNRIATVLLYLTDVQLGGFTSFPLLNMGVQPKKGAALMWHNVNNAAESDKRMLHAACPVLQGNRWVAAQWFEMTK